MISFKIFGGVCLLTEWLIDLVEELLLELITLDEGADSGQTLAHLIRRESTHEVVDCAGDNLLLLG